MVRRVKEAMKKETQSKEKNIKNRQKTYKEQETESRETALQSTISNDNKGFALLQKMGYKAGQGLGKQGKFMSYWFVKMSMFYVTTCVLNAILCCLLRSREGGSHPPQHQNWWANNLFCKCFETTCIPAYHVLFWVFCIRQRWHWDGRGKEKKG